MILGVSGISFAQEKSEISLGYYKGNDFEIRYPSNWHTIIVTPSTLQIISSLQRVQAVTRDKKYDAAARSDYLADYKARNPDDRIVNYRKIDLTSADESGCRKINVITDLDEIGPKTFYLENHMYCDIGARVFRLDLVQWQADEFNQASFDVAVDMLKSLRAEPPSPSVGSAAGIQGHN